MIGRRWLTRRWLCTTASSPLPSAAPSAGRERGAGRSNRATVIVLGVPVVITTCLGIWQVYRLEWKRRQIQLRTDKLHGEVLEGIPKDVGQKKEDEFRRVRLHGTFLPDKELLFGPRSMPLELPANLSPQTGGVGYYALCPLRQDDGSVILVNRGWLPMNPREKQVIQEAPPGPVEVEGVIRFSDNRTRWTPENKPEEKRWFWIDVPGVLDAIEEKGPPIFVETLADSSKYYGLPWPKGYLDHLNFYVDPITHFAYAITWFTLALFMASMIYSKLYGRWGRTVRQMENFQRRQNQQMEKAAHQESKQQPLPGPPNS